MKTILYPQRWETSLVANRVAQMGTKGNETNMG